MTQIEIKNIRTGAVETTDEKGWERVQKVFPGRYKVVKSDQVLSTEAKELQEEAAIKKAEQDAKKAAERVAKKKAEEEAAKAAEADSK